MAFDAISNILSVIWSYIDGPIGGLILLGLVVGVHEFGHFICAKFVGARVDIFSIGFGKALWKRTYGETEYRICLIPLGGYVKIYGQDPEEVEDDPDPEPHRSLSEKKLLERILVFSGGPVFNFILATVIFSLLAFIGIHVLPAKATRVVVNSPAWVSGLRSGDKILRINEEKVTKLEEVFKKIAAHPEKDLPFEIKRQDKIISLRIPIQKMESYTKYGETTMAGVLKGLNTRGRAAVVASTTGTNTWGLKTGDQILSVGDSKINSWEDLEIFFERRMTDLPSSLTFVVMRDKEKKSITTPDLGWLQKRLSPEWDAHRLLETVGMYCTELFVKSTTPKSPAHEAGVMPGDRIISVSGKKVYSFNELKTLIGKAGKNRSALAKDGEEPNFAESVELLIERQGKTLRIKSGVTRTRKKDPLGKTIFEYTVGILSQGMESKPTDLILERTLNPFLAFGKGTMKMVKHTKTTVIGIKKLIVGEVSSSAIGGPIMIFKVAGDSFSYSWRAFVRLIAIISIALGVFNLLPVPVLDGGHIMFALIESARGKPISPEAIQTVMKVGISLLLILMVFATYNDIIKTFNIHF